MHVISTLEPIFAFSRNHCVAICAFLVPANLITTLTILSLSALSHSPRYLKALATLEGGLALIMMLHVATWFMIGVVTPITFILIGLALTCLVATGVTITYPTTYRTLITLMMTRLRELRLQRA